MGAIKKLLGGGAEQLKPLNLPQRPDPVRLPSQQDQTSSREAERKRQRKRSQRQGRESTRLTEGGSSDYAGTILGS